VSGLYEGTKEKQLEVFFDELKKASLRFSDTPCPTTWKEAFDLLKTYINGLRGKEKKVIFIDEEEPLLFAAIICVFYTNKYFIILFRIFVF
jgi:hypothetical protein